MKKRCILLLIIAILFLSGCTKSNSESILKDLTNKVNNLKSYTLEGQLEVQNKDNTYNYQVSANYMSKDKFRVSLINVSNNHEQIILRNDDGVYVLTPSLNKSFKFQSDWPYNNSQIYLLGSIIEDLNNDSEIIKEEIDGKYIYTSKVNYPNNNDLVKQKVTVNSDLLIEKIEILNSSNTPEMTFNISNINYNPQFDESYFEVNSIINNNSINNDLDEKIDNESNEDEKTTNDQEIEQTATLDDIIYPLYLPTGTVLKEQEKVNKTNGERVILTFSGDKEFTLVEETSVKEKEFTVIPTYGEPFLINDTIGSMTNNSLNWTSGNIEYYIVSEVMNSEELLDIARSINIKAVSSMK